MERVSNGLPYKLCGGEIKMGEAALQHVFVFNYTKLIYQTCIRSIDDRQPITPSNLFSNICSTLYDEEEVKEEEEDDAVVYQLWGSEYGGTHKVPLV